MSERYRVWQRVEHLLELVRRQRERVTKLGDTDVAWSIGEHAAEIDREVRLLALDSGCTTHFFTDDRRSDLEPGA